MHIHTYGYLVDVKKIILVFGLNIDKKNKKKEGKKKTLFRFDYSMYEPLH